MGENSNIEWTHHTWNPWRGCTKVSPGCKNCYMFREQKRYGRDPRIVTRTSPQTWNQARRWNREAEREGVRKLVFTCSWSDWCHEAADAWRPEAWQMIHETPNLIYQILTKRADRIPECLPEDWGTGYKNVWLGTSVENQATADARIPHLLCCPAAVRFLSCEPLLGAMDLGLQNANCDCCPRWASRWIKLKRQVTSDMPFDASRMSLPGIYRAHGNRHGALSVQTTQGLLGVKPAEFDCLPGVDWVICGGESGAGARPMHPAWARGLRDQCVSAGVSFFMKQMDKKQPIPDDLLIREFPEVSHV